MTPARYPKAAAGADEILARLDRLRRSLPLAWWLVYDGLVAVALFLAFVRPWLGLVVGVPWLLIAALIDSVEYLSKRRVAKTDR